MRRLPNRVSVGAAVRQLLLLVPKLNAKTEQSVCLLNVILLLLLCQLQFRLVILSAFGDAALVVLMTFRLKKLLYVCFKCVYS